MEKVILAYSYDLKSNRTLNQFSSHFSHSRSLTKRSLVDLFSFDEFKSNPFSHVMFLSTIDFYLANQDAFLKLNQNQGNHHCSHFLVMGKDNFKKLNEVSFKNSITLVPDDGLNELFHKVPTQATPDLESLATPKKTEYSKKILEIATILGSERNIELLMNKILTACMEVVDADAGSLAILGYDKHLMEVEKDTLTFYVSKNNSKEINFNRFSMKINLNSLAGFSIIRKKLLNIPDVYKIEEDAQYSFNNSFDKQTGFRTKSILVIPMIDSRENVMGVIQLLNKKKDGYNKLINYDDFHNDQVVEFSYSDQSTVLGITNLATVLLRNQLLYNQVNGLLENFVKASVYAVEQRDPATSGHSDRVAHYSVELAKKATEARGVMEDFNFDEQQIRELRYAALLHDFGKISVRERTLVKANKLENYELENILKKMRIYLLNFQLAAEQRKIALINNERLSSSVINRKVKAIEKQVQEEIKRMDYYRDIILESNVPKVIEEKVSAVLKEIRKIRYFDSDREQFLLSEEEFRFLSIPRGSLSEEERAEIEDHVTQSFYFLERINWISELKNIPEIAYGHHEKLDGKGYPRRLKAHQIMPQTKIMTVCDIFDALTASDRPYKKSLPVDKSIKILYEEVENNKIDRNLVDLFVKKKIYISKPTSSKE